MAVTSAPQWAALARRALATSAVASIALVALAVPASAHTGQPSAKCTDVATTLTLHLEKYKEKKGEKNSVLIKDGDTVVVNNPDFGDEYKFSDEKTTDGKPVTFDNTVDHHFTVVVRAWDDPIDGKDHAKKMYSFDWAQTVEACVVRQTSSVTPPPPPPSSEVPTPSSQVPVPTTTVAIGANANLAETGASIGLPIGIGALLLLGGAGLLFVIRRRDRA